jgi:hypothetical protein
MITPTPVIPIQVLVREKPYKVYRALLTQSGTNAPTANVLENTLGTVTFGYTGIGTYTVTATGLLTLNKTTIVLGNNVNSLFSNVPILSTSALTLNGFSIYTGDALAQDVINSMLLNTLIEIKVYE